MALAAAHFNAEIGTALGKFPYPHHPLGTLHARDHRPQTDSQGIGLHTRDHRPQTDSQGIGIVLWSLSLTQPVVDNCWR